MDGTGRRRVALPLVWVEVTLASVCTILWWFSEPGLLTRDHTERVGLSERQRIGLRLGPCPELDLTPNNGASLAGIATSASTEPLA